MNRFPAQEEWDFTECAPGTSNLGAAVIYEYSRECETIIRELRQWIARPLADVLVLARKRNDPRVGAVLKDISIELAAANNGGDLLQAARNSIAMDVALPLIIPFKVPHMLLYFLIQSGLILEDKPWRTLPEAVKNKLCAVYERFFYAEAVNISSPELASKHFPDTAVPRQEKLN